MNVELLKFELFHQLNRDHTMDRLIRFRHGCKQYCPTMKTTVKAFFLSTNTIPWNTQFALVFPISSVLAKLGPERSSGCSS
ncbi:hypothetical protein WICANDRAFT_82900 [Wickerhamomyces anomalus NRRL Y-366-8]|uniref:Uncharacterized protein n=1 Tax=Wickerhamomyces anomalus (strain ATCC 58044 / CBS 1984 / NCYC 433 / NRRL Y-366-8) TaxID=683960 RepID=A0A1E3PDS3_WICAA|nr:uncharacterized protein WICANDRAFT_82900 [Wickerhamomyces anomalus NRRL Y-366-8]ODQ63017.1 hypothetical protein WICANDRAFT_82900 [Wickerhamomyces anomalus NRRL Y-366-8]